MTIHSIYYLCQFIFILTIATIILRSSAKLYHKASKKNKQPLFVVEVVTVVISTIIILTNVQDSAYVLAYVLLPIGIFAGFNSMMYTVHTAKYGEGTEEV